MSNHSYPPDKCTFELLSAYLDGEVTAQQRQEIQELLSKDTEIQNLYNRLLYLRQELNNLPTPPSPCTAQQLSEAVFARVDRTQKQRKMFLWGSGAIAAVILAAISGIFTPQRTPLLQMAQNNDSKSNDEALIIALNEPLIEMPRVKEENLMIPLDHSLLEIQHNK